MYVKYLYINDIFKVINYLDLLKINLVGGNFFLKNGYFGEIVFLYNFSYFIIIVFFLFWYLYCLDCR